MITYFRCLGVFDINPFSSLIIFNNFVLVGVFIIVSLDLGNDLPAYPDVANNLKSFV